jgi:membrane protein DedA with SNARE-associated domain
MTSSIALLVIVGGILALFTTIASIFGVRTIMKRGINHPAKALLTTNESVRMFVTVRNYVPVFFGVLSLSQSTALVSTGLGASVCVGIAFYFALQGVASVRPPDARKVGFLRYNLTPAAYLQFITASLYAAAAITTYVI